MDTASALTDLRRAALHWLAERDPGRKAAGASQLWDSWQRQEVSLDADALLQPAEVIPGRPDQPLLVEPRKVPHRSMGTAEGRAALLHALAHIEFNAINLALDVIWRFLGMPRDFYADWLKVAAEEALHFSLLRDHLDSIGYRYGDFPAHNGLWEMAEKTKDDVLARIALVPRTMEARGLDVTPALRAKLAGAGDAAAASILDIILRDEIGHVAVGNRWYNWLCVRRSVSPADVYGVLAERYGAPALRGPFNVEARRQAGFSEEELAELMR